MKALYALLILLLIYLYNDESCSPTDTEPTKASDCKDHTLSDGYAKCCFSKVKKYDSINEKFEALIENKIS